MPGTRVIVLRGGHLHDWDSLPERCPLNATPDTEPAPILVVDDDPLVLRALCRMLAGVCPALGVTSLREAHEYFDDHAPTAVVLDVHLIEGFGWEVLVAARERDPLMPALIITGQSWSELADQAHAIHALVREKPIEAEELRAFARYALTLRKTAAPRVDRLISELRHKAGLSRREARFVEDIVLRRPMDDARRMLEGGVLTKTGHASAGDVRNALLEVFFAHARPFR